VDLFGLLWGIGRPQAQGRSGLPSERQLLARGRLLAGNPGRQGQAVPRRKCVGFLRHVFGWAAGQRLLRFCTAGALTMRACVATRCETELREMASAMWTKRRMAAAIGVDVNTISRALRANGIHHGGNRWSEKRFRTHPVVSTLRSERMALGLTLDQFARKVGYNRSIVGEWERGARRMSLDALQNVAQALGYDITLTRRG
jgi:DNA-binding XRE family transcriptional regulator